MDRWDTSRHFNSCARKTDRHRWDFWLVGISRSCLNFYNFLIFIIKIKMKGKKQRQTGGQTDRQKGEFCSAFHDLLFISRGGLICGFLNWLIHELKTNKSTSSLNWTSDSKHISVSVYCDFVVSLKKEDREFFNSHSRVSGYLLGKIGKAAAMAVGGSLIILQVCICVCE